jgi:hypothetical protein
MNVPSILEGLYLSGLSSLVCLMFLGKDKHSSGLYYKCITIVNDVSSVSDAPNCGVTYERN